MYQMKTISLKSHSNFAANGSILDLLRHFKYEFLKVLVFLMLFAASILYTNAESKAYYQIDRTSLGK